jgi:hypothetical protein
MSETIAGVTIPDTKLVAEATELVREAASPLLFNHSRRVYLFGMLPTSRAAAASPLPPTFRTRSVRTTDSEPPMSGSGRSSLTRCRHPETAAFVDRPMFRVPAMFITIRGRLVCDARHSMVRAGIRPAARGGFHARV